MKTLMKLSLALFVCGLLSACSATIYESHGYDSWNHGDWGWEHNGWGGTYWYGDWDDHHHHHH